jgi:hypothetical protein
MRNWLLLTLLLILLPQAHSAEPRAFGAPMPAGDARSIAAIVSADALPSEAPQKVTGRITEVCQSEGCWLVLEDEGHAARVMMHDHAFTVPKDIAGTTATVFGSVSVKQLDEKTAKHLAEDAGKEGPVALREYRIDATSVVLTDA